VERPRANRGAAILGIAREEPIIGAVQRGATERIGARSSPISKTSVATTRSTVSAAPEKISPRSVRPKIATGIVTQPGG
jgi:hypothetical protein